MCKRSFREFVNVLTTLVINSVIAHESVQKEIGEFIKQGQGRMWGDGTWKAKL